MNHWDERFKQDSYAYGTEPNVFLKDAHKKLNITGNALAIAEGEGRNAVYLAQSGMNVTAWDYSKEGLMKTEKLARDKEVSVHTELVDLNEASWEKNKWDELVCIFGHFPEELRNKTLHGIKDAVKPGGYFISEVYSSFQLPYKSGGPKDLELLYRPEEFLNTFSDWRIIHFFMGEVERKEGEFHNGLSHVIQFVGKKPE
ncbi:MAG TPA: class I SAM-dependent methyltransferase [Metabacillus sp.]|nr:class I SAM-dependent methyltransferase [Metabacillus sp.]